MNLSNNLVEQFRHTHFAIFNKPIDHRTAEHELKELAQLLRITQLSKGV